MSWKPLELRCSTDKLGLEKEHPISTWSGPLQILEKDSVFGSDKKQTVTPVQTQSSGFHKKEGQYKIVLYRRYS